MPKHYQPLAATLYRACLTAVPKAMHISKNGLWKQKKKNKKNPNKNVWKVLTEVPYKKQMGNITKKMETDDSD